MTRLILVLLSCLAIPFSAVAFPADYDGDGNNDLMIYRPVDYVSGGVSYSRWYIIPSSGAQPPCFAPTGFGTGYQQQFGLLGDVPISGDYDGDHKADVAVWRKSNKTFYVKFSSWCGTAAVYMGGGSNPITINDIPDEYDVTGDGKSDILFFRPGGLAKYIIRNSTTLEVYGFNVGPGVNNPVDPANVVSGPYVATNVQGEATGYSRGVLPQVPPGQNTYPGVAYTSVSFDLGNWGINGGSYSFQKISSQFFNIQHQDIPVQGNWGGASSYLADYIRWRPSDGVWRITLNGGPSTAPDVQWGLNGDIPISGDFNRDGLLEPVVWRPSNGIWYVKMSSCPPYMTPNSYSGCERQWGLPNSADIPVG